MPCLASLPLMCALLAMSLAYYLMAYCCLDLLVVCMLASGPARSHWEALCSTCIACGKIHRLDPAGCITAALAYMLQPMFSHMFYTSCALHLTVGQQEHHLHTSYPTLCS